MVTTVALHEIQTHRALSQANPEINHNITTQLSLELRKQVVIPHLHAMRGYVRYSSFVQFAPQYMRVSSQVLTQWYA